MNNLKVVTLIILAVALAAILLGARYSGFYKQPQISNPTSSTQTSSQPSIPDTSTWQTYRNEKYGFELRYPESWAGISSSTSLGVNGQKLDEILVLDDDADSRIVIDPNGGFDRGYPLGVTPKKSSVLLGGSPTARIDYPQGDYTWTILRVLNPPMSWSRDSNKLELSYGVLPRYGYRSGVNEIIDQILSTFKFTK